MDHNIWNVFINSEKRTFGHKYIIMKRKMKAKSYVYLGMEH